MMRPFHSYILVAGILLLASLCAGGCVSTSQALELEATVNNPVMRDLQDNDEDITQIEDGSGAVGEAATCPT